MAHAAKGLSNELIVKNVRKVLFYYHLYAVTEKEKSHGLLPLAPLNWGPGDRTGRHLSLPLS
jgi:hypothetical protein